MKKKELKSKWIWFGVIRHLRMILPACTRKKKHWIFVELSNLMDFLIHYLKISFINWVLAKGGQQKKECHSFATGPNQKCLNWFRIRIYQELCDFVFALAEPGKWDFRFIYQIRRIMLNGLVTLHGSINRDSLTVNIRPNMHCNGEYFYQFYRKKAFIAIHLLITVQKMNLVSRLIAKFKYIHIHFGHSFHEKNQIDSWSRATTQVSKYSWIIRQLWESLRWNFKRVPLK